MTDDLQARLAALSPARREALRRALAERASADAVPLSSGQERLWFLHRFDPSDTSYSISWGMNLRGPLDIDGLRTALTAVVSRHEILRTRFPLVGDRPMQVVAPPGPFELELCDDVEAFADRPFDLTKEPPLRGALRVHDSEYATLCLVIHHVAVDGWSMDLLMSDISEHYTAYREKRPAEVEQVKVQYRDYVEWERSHYNAEHLRYWVRTLAGVPVLDLPGDRQRPARWSGLGARLDLDIDIDTTKRFDKAVRAGRGTLFMGLLAAFQVAVGDAAGQEDFCVGVPVLGAGRGQFPDMIGYLSNTIAVRADLRGDPTFGELVGRTKATVLAALQHAEAPFDAVIRALRLPRDLSRPPLCQVMFNLTHNLPKAGLLKRTMADLDVEILGAITAGRAKADVSADVHRGPGGLDGAFEYNSDLFTAETGRRLERAFTGTVAAAAADPGIRLSRLREALR